MRQQGTDWGVLQGVAWLVASATVTVVVMLVWVFPALVGIAIRVQRLAW